MKKTLMGGCFALLSLGTAAQAATEFPGGLIPQELAQEFGGNEQYYSSLPDNFPLTNLGLDLSLQVIGSTQNGSYYSRVLLRGDVSAAELASALAPALLNTGWLVMSISGSPENRYATLCHDQLGSLSLRARDEPSDGSRLSLTLSQIPRNCVQEKASEEQRATLQSALLNQLRNLELPPGAIFIASPLGIRGISSNNSQVEISQDTMIHAPDSSAAELYQYFATQLEAEGWSEDSGGDGERTAGGIWLRSLDLAEDAEANPDASSRIDLVSSLSLIDHGGDRYEFNTMVQTGSPPELSELWGSSGGAPATGQMSDWTGPPSNTPQLGIRGIPVGYMGGRP